MINDGKHYSHTVYGVNTDELREVPSGHTSDDHVTTIHIDA